MPISPTTREKIKAVSPHTKIEWTVVYIVFQRALPFRFHNCGDGTPEDKQVGERNLRLLPRYLEQSPVKPNQVKELGRLEAVVEGFKLSEDSQVPNEKLAFEVL